MSSGCYAHRTADEELLDFPPRVLPNADAGSSSVGSSDAAVRDAAVRDAAVSDAGSTSRCSGADPISVLLCNLTSPTPGGSNTNAVSDLTKLLDSAGGLASIAAVLGAFTGTGRVDAGVPAAQPSLVDLVNLAGGLGNIATLLNGLLGGTAAQPGARNPIADLIAAFAQSSSANNMPPARGSASPTLLDWLSGLGLAQPQTVAKSRSTPTLTAPTASECAAALEPSTQLFCTLQAAQAGTSLAK